MSCCCRHTPPARALHWTGVASPAATSESTCRGSRGRMQGGGALVVNAAEGRGHDGEHAQLHLVGGERARLVAEDVLHHAQVLHDVAVARAGCLTLGALPHLRVKRDVHRALRAQGTLSRDPRRCTLGHATDALGRWPGGHARHRRASSPARQLLSGSKAWQGLCAATMARMVANYPSFTSAHEAHDDARVSGMITACVGIWRATWTKAIDRACFSTYQSIA